MTQMPQKIALHDYAPHAYGITHIDLCFDLDDTKTNVTAISKVQRRISEDLILDGHSMILLKIKIDDVLLTEAQYSLEEQRLVIFKSALPDADDFTLYIQTQCDPLNNTSLEGLYRSGNMFCTQCEAQGFRKITYFIDRPDNMAIFDVKIIGQKAMPILLSNGHLKQQGQGGDGRPFAIWQDPHKKPSYLFALVAGDLAVVTDRFTTMSGRKVDLQIYVEHGNEDGCDFAMQSLKKAMTWDEEYYGREYDLDLFMIVAVSDFNFGAMENKGLNIFNDKYILAKSDIATDQDYKNIEAIVAHEYFHNWTGNRITCREWFQLCLKEGLTVFRDQSFSGDMRCKTTQRIEDVTTLRLSQFPEDAGPLSHAVRPEEYIEINNFYTATIYEKGAEICRMLHHILGKDGFRKGTDLYFERYDGMAVTVEDFISAMADANDIDLTHFKLWYSQSGTPHIHATKQYNDSNNNYTLSLRQEIKPTANQREKLPLYIPIKLGFMSEQGTALVTDFNGETKQEHFITLSEDEEDFTFENVPQGATISLFREFSAPVILHIEQSLQERFSLMQYDTDYFNRFEAGQNLVTDIITDIYKDPQKSDLAGRIESYCLALGTTLGDDNIDANFKSKILSLPTVGYMMQKIASAHPQKIHHARIELQKQIADYHEASFKKLYDRYFSAADFNPEPQYAAPREFSNRLLSYLCISNSAPHQDRLLKHYNMTDMTHKMGALGALSNRKDPLYEQLIGDFYQSYHQSHLVLDKWFGLQARLYDDNSLMVIKSLLEHKDFDIKNPNRIRSVLSVFAHGNPAAFHTPKAYDFMVEQILFFDKRNPKLASGMATAFETLTILPSDLKGAGQKSLGRILAQKDNISNDLFEITDKILK